MRMLQLMLRREQEGTSAVSYQELKDCCGIALPSSAQDLLSSTVHENGNSLSHLVLMLLGVGAPFVRQIVEWEAFLRSTKRDMWKTYKLDTARSAERNIRKDGNCDRIGDEVIDENLVLSAGGKVLQRLFFVLFTQREQHCGYRDFTRGLDDMRREERSGGMGLEDPRHTRLYYGVETGDCGSGIAR